MTKLKLATTTLCAAVMMLTATPAKSMVIIPCGTSTDHFVTQPYTIQPGETLQSIARATYQDPSRFKDIANYNKIQDPNRIQAGDMLELRVVSQENFLGRFYDSTAIGMCSFANTSGFEYTGKTFHPPGTTREDIE